MLKHIAKLVVACISLASSIVFAPTAAATCFNISNPVANTEQTPGVPFTVQWTSCAGVNAVDIYIADLDRYQVGPTLVANTLNDTTEQATFPTANLPCNRRYVLKMKNAENSAQQSWGPPFTVKCDIKVTKTSTPSTYTISIFNNGTNPIIPLINATGMQTRSVPVFSFQDTLPAGVTLSSIAAQNGQGTWTTPSFSIAGPQTFLFEFRLNTQTTIPGGPNAPIASITFNATKPSNCIHELMHRSTNLTTGTSGTVADYNPANNTGQCAQ